MAIKDTPKGQSGRIDRNTGATSAGTKTPGTPSAYSNPSPSSGGGGGSSPAPTIPSTGTYVVPKYDAATGAGTLSGIAKTSGYSIQDILKLNPEITNPNLIREGQTIKLPGGGTSATGGYNPATGVATGKTGYIAGSDAQKKMDGTVASQVSELQRQYEMGLKSFSQTQRQMQKTIDDYIKRLQQRADQEMGIINSKFDQEKNQLKEQQRKDFGASSMGLARMGGFLGGSASSIGYLNELNEQNRMEVASLETRRADAIRQAQNAVDDKDYAAAQDAIKLQKDIETEINDRYQQHFENVRKLQSDDLTKRKGEMDLRASNLSILAPVVMSQLTGDPAEDEAIITAIATQNGVDPQDLAGAVFEYKRASQKDLPSMIQEYNYVVENGLFSGTFAEYQQLRGAKSGTPKSKILSVAEAADIGMPELQGVEEDELRMSVMDSDGKIRKTPPEWFYNTYRMRKMLSAPTSNLPGVDMSKVNVTDEEVQKAWDTARQDKELEGFLYNRKVSEELEVYSGVDSVQAVTEPTTE